MLPRLASDLPAVGTMNLDTGGSKGVADWALAGMRRPGLAASLIPMATAGNVRGVLRLLVRDQQTRRLRGEPGHWLIDDGTWHRLLWLAAFSSSSDVALKAAERLARPDVVFFVPVSAEVALARTRARLGGGDILLRMDHGEARAAVDRYERYLRRLCTAMGVPVVTEPHDLTELLK